MWYELRVERVLSLYMYETNEGRVRTVFVCMYVRVSLYVFFAVWLFCLVILNRTVAVKFIRIMVVKVVRR